MTREKLEEIKTLARDPKSAAFHDLMARQTIPLIEALEWQAAMTKALSESQERLVQEVKDARTELGEALDELAFIKEGYGDGDSAEMTEDALLLKVKAITLDYNKVREERDEARAEVERLRSAISWFVAQSPWQDRPEIQELKALKEEG